MQGGTKALCLMACLTAGCTADGSQLSIRPINDPGAKLRGGTDRFADARGQLALGNVGLAIEAFRTGVREQPDNPEGYAGLAACYDAMGRYDLARLNLESALAIAPRNPALLTALAATLDHAGQREAATQVRSEAAGLLAASAALDQARSDPAEVRGQYSSTVTVKLPPARPAPVAARAQPVEVPKPSLGTAVVELRTPSQSLAVHRDLRLAEIPIAMPDADVPRPLALEAAVTLRHAAIPAVVQLDTLPMAKLGRSDLALADFVVVPPTIEVPRPRLTPARVELATSVVAYLARPEISGLAVDLTPAPAEASQPKLKLKRAQVDLDVRAAPRLERTSLGEVALITGSGPVWRPQPVDKPAQVAALRFVPVRMAMLRPDIRVLNAARSQGLAARTRALLADRGWRRLRIGDADRVRMHSLVLYPAGRQQFGRRLAAQFGFRAAAHNGVGFLVLLGRDWAGSRPARTHG